MQDKYIYNMYMKNADKIKTLTMRYCKLMFHTHLHYISMIKQQLQLQVCISMSSQSIITSNKFDTESFRANKKGCYRHFSHSLFSALLFM